MCWTSDLLKGLPAGIVALIVAAISWRQYLVARAKLKLDLFDRRYAIFQQTWEILSEVTMRGTREKSYGLATPFNNFLPQARFLFGKKIADYLDQASTNWNELHGLEGERADVAGADRQNNIARTRKLKNWFFKEASDGCKQMFDEYLDFERWK
jgi:hypothetical protein